MADPVFVSEGRLVNDEGQPVNLTTLTVTPSEAYTQTYATADRTHANPTAVVVATTGATDTTPFGYTTAEQADAIVTNLNALVADLADVKQVLNAVIDDLQAKGILG